MKNQEETSDRLMNMAQRLSPADSVAACGRLKHPDKQETLAQDSGSLRFGQMA
jgi:hypothetical protein